MRKLGVAVLLGLACSGGGDGGPGPGAGGSGGGTAGTGGRGGATGGGGRGGASATGGTGGITSPDGGGTGGTSGGAGGDGGGGAGGAGPDGGPGADQAGGTGGEPPDAGPDAPPPAARNPFVYVGSSTSSDIRIFELNLQSGALAARGMATSGPSPNYLAFHPSGRFLYAISERMGAAGRIHAFAINTDTGALTRLNDASSGGNGPAHVSVHKHGKWAFAANYTSGHVAALPIMDDGSLRDAVTPVDAGAMPHMILDDGQTGKFVFVPLKGSQRIAQYRFDETTGALTPNTPATVTQDGAPRHMAFHRSGQWAYLLTEAGRSVISYRYDPASGLLGGGMARMADGGARSDGAHIAIHPSKDIVYASIRDLSGGGSGAIAHFAIGPDGRVGAPTQVTTPFARPWDFSIDPTGQYLIAGNNDAASVRVFRINQDSGALTILAGATAVAAAPRCVAILAR